MFKKTKHLCKHPTWTSVAEQMGGGGAPIQVRQFRS